MGKPNDDLKADTNVKRIDELESFRKEYEGKEFDKKVLQSIADSSTIQEMVKNLAWKTFREKIVWILLGGVGVIIIDLLIRAIPHMIKAIP